MTDVAGPDPTGLSRHAPSAISQQALTHALDGHEAETLAEAHGRRLGVSDDPDAQVFGLLWPKLQDKEQPTGV